MDSQRILRYLSDIAANNSREWYLAHKAEYNIVRADFEHAVADALARIAAFDSSIAHLTVKDCVYRFNRDTRFSPDKAPYKRHFGAYMAAHGKKALHGGYYIHLQPGACMLACGCYWLPTNILTATRNEIMGNINDWRHIVESKRFVELFGRPGDATWDDNDGKGFGNECLKTAPAGFPRDYEFIQYIRMKDYCCWRNVPDDFFDDPQWLDRMAEVFMVARPMLDFVNAVIDDYE